MYVRWPVINTPLPDGPGEAISLDYFGPLPTTSDGNKHIWLSYIVLAIVFQFMLFLLPSLLPLEPPIS